MEINVFREYLKSKGLRLTEERRVIFKEVSLRKGHFDPDELYIDMRRKGIKPSKASVYRTLPLLVSVGLIEQVQKTDKHTHYERISGHHDHMFCISCGHVIEFYSKPLERLQEKLCKVEGFQSISHTLEIKGRCNKCKTKSKP
ncbi:MAG: transcriptional repressor [Nitrospirae bacterium]|nr:transcriptional repressor [Nitrospirota bacterium]